MRHSRLFQSAVLFVSALFVFESLVLASEPGGNIGSQDLDIQMRNMERLGYAANQGIGNKKNSASRNVPSTVRIPDQRTRVLGGNAQAVQAGQTGEGVPVLGKIPLVGRLFRQRRAERDERSLLIHTRPALVNPQDGE